MLFQQFAGSQGDILLSIMMLPLLFIIWSLTNRMPKRKNTKAHLHLTVTLSASAIYHVWISMSEPSDAGAGLHIMRGIFLLCTFFALFLTFNEIAKWEQAVVYASCVVTVLISAVVPLPALQPILAILLGCAAWYYLAPEMPNVGKAKATLSLFLGAELVTLINLFIGSTGAVGFINAALFISAYTVLISFVADYLVQILRGTYESSISDPLTGLYNRKQFSTYVKRSIEKGADSKVIFIDIDNFKKLNDTFGHKKGDEVLKQVASIMMEETEGVGVAGRYGGEEIVALVVEPGVDMDELTESIRSRIEKEASFDTSQGVHPVTASIGYCRYIDGMTAEELVKRADEAMYVAKRSGKNRVVQYGDQAFIDYNTTTAASTAQGKLQEAGVN